MKYYKLLSGLCLMIVFLSMSVFGVGVYENGNYLFYTNKAEPIVDINITAGSTELKIKEAVLSIPGQEDIRYGSGIEFMNRFSSREFSFDLRHDISTSTNARFKLFVYNRGETSLIQPQGDPVDFYFSFDNKTPSLLDIDNLIYDEKKVVLEFDEPINVVRVRINDKVFTAKNVVNNIVLDDRFVEVFFDSFDFGDEFYNIVIEFEDLAGNLGSESTDIYVPTEPLKISLLTLQNDSSLLYNYDARYKDLFEGNIYTSNNNFELKIKTNKPAVCYFSSEFLSFQEFENVNEDSKFSFDTTDDLVHSYQVGALDNIFWVACVNKYVNSDVAYLDDYFGKKLIDVKVYTGDDLKLLLAEPTSLVTNNPFSLFAKTNERAVCFYQLDSSDEVMFDSSDFKNFEKLDVSVQGKQHKLKFKCIDVMNDDAVESYNIEVDDSLGVRVTGYNPKYTMTSSVDVELSLSDVAGVDCRYSTKQEPITEFGNLTALVGTGVIRTLKASGLKSGENEYFVYCNKNDQVKMSPIVITYDSKGIVISDFTFINGDYKSSDYIGSTSKIEFEFKVESLIPIKEYFARFVLNNKSMQKSFSSSKASIKGDFSNVNEITIIAINELGINKSFSETIKFDSTAPIIMISDVAGGKKIVCTDPESLCAATFYGFAQTSIECRANANYDSLNNSILNVEGKNYLCVESFNHANLREFKVEQLSSLSPLGNKSVSDIFDGNETGNESSIEPDDNTDPQDDEDDPADPFNITPDEGDEGSGGTIAIIAAIIILIAGTGGGGYYAYRKGYLDKELAKLGIHVPARNNENSNGTNKAKFSSTPIANETPSKNLKKSGYDHHLNKLNKFIDDKLNKSSSTFDAFDEPNKGKVKGYKDTLVHNQRKSDLSKEDFDEFYSGSAKGKQGFDVKESLEKEGESFEKYYKKKKANIDKKSDSNK